MAKIDALIFDLDGVIVDTAVFHFKAWKRLADELNIPFTQQDNERLKGVSRVQSFEILLSLGNITMPENEKIPYRDKKNQWFVEYISQMRPEDTLPGVKEFIRTSRADGKKIVLGLASKNAKVVLENVDLMDAFDAIIDGTKVSSAKPDPEVFLKGASAVDVAPEHCIVFEDAVAGVEAALNGGMYCIGVGDPNTLSKAHWVVPGIGQIDYVEFKEKLLSL